MLICMVLKNGVAAGMFAMGFESTDKYTGVFGDDATLLTTGMSVESTLTDWCDLRIGYDRKFNFLLKTVEQKAGKLFLQVLDLI